MNCKNCNNDLSSQSKYCDRCGAKVVKERITFKNLLSSLFVDSFGWDNKFFFTIKSLIVRPELPFTEFINGTRKKFVSPFAFFAICAALSLLVFNFFEEEFIRQANEFGKSELSLSDKDLNERTIKFSSKEQLDSKLAKRKNKKSPALDLRTQQTILKYYNFYSFLILPFYALIAFIVFGKPYNYGEHLIINAYIQGLLLLLAILIFFTDIVTGFSANLSNLLVSLLYYPYAYIRLYKLSATKTIFSLLKFLGVVIVIIILLILLLFFSK